MMPEGAVQEREESVKETGRDEERIPSRVLIVLLGAIGDVTRALPLAVRIKQNWPSAELHWAVEPISRSLVEGHPAIDKVILFDRPRGFTAYCRFIRELSSVDYDVVLDLQRHLKSGVTAWLTRSKRRLGFHRKNAREFNWLFSTETILPVEHRSSKIEQFQKFGDSLGLEPVQPFEFGLRATEEEIEKIEELLGREIGTEEGVPPPEKRVALIIGSTWESRLWTVLRYQELIHSIHRRWGLFSVIVGGRREREFAEEILSRDSRLPAVNLVEKTTLRELVPLFSQVRLAVASDSGPMHIAAALGIPVISLWGSTSPLRSQPYGSESYVLQSGIGCSPCYRRKCPGLNGICMSDIPAQAVIAQMERILDDET